MLSLPLNWSDEHPVTTSLRVQVQDGMFGGKIVCFVVNLSMLDPLISPLGPYDSSDI